MQLREEVVTAANTKECPANDWMCKFFENGGCKLNNAEKQCTHMIKNAKTVKTIME